MPRCDGRCPEGKIAAVRVRHVEGSDRIGGYELLAELGRGAFGVVHRARHPSLGHEVALKTVRADDPDLAGSLRREIHVLARIRHPGVVRILDHGVHGGRPWYAMELHEGVTLREGGLALEPRPGGEHAIASRGGDGAHRRRMASAPGQYFERSAGLPDPSAYEERVRADIDLQLEEIGRFVTGEAAVQREQRELARRLDEAGVPYAVAGALALGAHGFVRATVDIDILLTTEGLAWFASELVGREYRPAFEGARKKFRAAATGVRIDVLQTGEFPGDGKPKPVQFPDPRKASIAIAGIRYVTLEKLVELKLASGTSAPHRLSDLADVISLIRASQLPEGLAEALDPSVRAAYRDLWARAQTKDALDEEG